MYAVLRWARSDLGEEPRKLDDELNELSALERILTARLASIKRGKDRLRRKKVEQGLALRRVSDHAVLRYLERYKGFDVEAVREELRQLADESEPARDGEHHWHPSGVIMVIGDTGQIVTVLSAEQSEKWAWRKLGNGARIPAGPELQGLRPGMVVFQPEEGE